MAILWWLIEQPLFSIIEGQITTAAIFNQNFLGKYYAL
jgi:hypothetical protein